MVKEVRGRGDAISKVRKLVTCKFLPDVFVQDRLNLNYFRTDNTNYFTQILTEHGDFATYSKRFSITDNDTCRECGYKTNSIEHCLFECETVDKIWDSNI